MSIEIQFLYADVHGNRHRATFTQKTVANHFKRQHISDRPDRELLVETHDYRRGDL